MRLGVVMMTRPLHLVQVLLQEVAMGVTQVAVSPRPALEATLVEDTPRPLAVVVAEVVVEVAMDQTVRQACWTSSGRRPVVQAMTLQPFGLRASATSTGTSAIWCSLICPQMQLRSEGGCAPIQPP